MMAVSATKAERITGLRGLGLYWKIVKAGYTPSEMGLHKESGDVMRVSSRLRVAKAFEGLKLNGIGAMTVRAYNALTRVFFVHSALEQYVEIIGQEIWQIEEALKQCGSEDVVRDIFRYDRDGKLYDFLYVRLNKKLKQQIARCRDGKCHNVGIVSSALRHIFAHGYLSGNPNDVKPQRINRICEKVSTFLIGYIDKDFLDRMNNFAKGKKL